MCNEEVKSKLAPCGLLCEKCFAFNEGEIKHLSKELLEKLGNFDIYAQRFIELTGNPVFKKYPHFKDFLTFLSIGRCKGCRYEECQLNLSCNVKFCYLSENVDFCFECPHFPCNLTGFDEHLLKRWETANLEMKSNGVNKYYHRIKDLPRYI